MALLIDCPGCGNQIVNNGQDCPFCGYNVKTGKTREQIEQELLEAEEALRAEEEAKAAEEARRLEEEKRAAEEAQRLEEEKRAAEEAKRLEQERLAEQARLAAEEAKRQAQQNTIFAKFQQRNTARNQQTDISDKVNNDIDNLPEMPSGDDSTLPPMQLDKPVPLSTIANTPAVPLTPLAKEKESSVLPPMQLEREVTMDEIRNTPAVPLSPIKNEEINDALPDINSPEAAPPKRSQPEITVEMPSQTAAPSVKSTPNIDVQVNIPQKPSVVLQKQETPVQQQPIQQQPPVQPPVQQQQPRPQRQWSANPNEFNNNQQPIQQQPPVVPQQPPVQQQQPRPQRQWSANPNEFNNNQPPIQQQPPVQQQQPRPQRQWSANPNEFNNNQPPVQQQQPRQPQPPVQQQQPRQPQQPRPQRQWSSNPNEFTGKQPLQPIEQQHSEVTATGERLENLPPQQVPSDPNFDQTSYVKNLKRQMYQGKIGGSNGSNPENDVLQNAANIPTQTMKYDENAKAIQGAKVNRVTAPKKSNTAILPVIIIIILIIGLAVTAYFILFKNGSSGDGDSSASSSGTSVAGTVTFKKPDDWDKLVYAYVFLDGDDELEKWPGRNMTLSDDGTYTLDIPEHFKSAYIVFNDGKDNHQYREKFIKEDQNLKVDFSTVYEVPAN